MGHPQQSDPSEIGNSAGKSSEQQMDNLWPGRFVKDKIYEETSKEYSTILPMLVKDDSGKAAKKCLQTTCRHVSDEKQSFF